MFFGKIQYDEPLFRPPAEARSAIVQATIGCSWNQCAFCEMYTSKKFRVRDPGEVKNDIQLLAGMYQNCRRVFIADGNAFVLSANKLLPVLKEINAYFPKLQRISSYALPKDILQKTSEELLMLRNQGLKLLYIGIETGDDELLQLIEKGETYKTTLKGISMAHEAGIDTSIMIINGLGGKNFSHQHALNSARIINELNPKYLSTLTLSFPFGLQHYETRFQGEYLLQTWKELFEELHLFIENLEVENVIYRSNHVSNMLSLEGTLSRDKGKLLQQLENAIKQVPGDFYPETSGGFQL
jgi:radical SAM superfamily enzyme YgiQ (UPF0313 family)